jgi:alpha-tubulin suppressor-like RCC1 family protein
MAHARRSTTGARRSPSIGFALALALLLAGAAQAPAAPPARPRVSVSAVVSDGAVVAHARIVLHGSKRSARWRAVLQQRTLSSGRARWRDRASAAVRTSAPVVRWRRRGAGIRGVVRVSLRSGHTVLARSRAVRVVQAGRAPVAAGTPTTTPATRPLAPAAPVAATSGPDASLPGPAADPGPDPGRGTIVGISAGMYHACALRSRGGIDCWGGNESGQMGNGTSGHSLTPEPVVGIDDAVAVAAGDSHSCALLEGHSVKCWGFGGTGQLGSAATPGGGYHSYVPVDVVGLSDATAIATGGLFTCALRATGTVACWGSGAEGQLGDPGLRYSGLPSPVPGVSGAVAITAGSSYACALLTAGTVDCWGDASFGSLGTGSYTADGSPAPVIGVANAVAISASQLHTCALIATGSIACWGHNNFGALGNGTTDDALTAVAVTGIDDATAVSAGNAYSCALHAAGTISCWGYDAQGQLGDGADPNLDPDRFTTVPGPVTATADARAVSAGGAHACALLASSTVECWGLNDRGQFGNGTETSSSTPVEVSLAP